MPTRAALGGAQYLRCQEPLWSRTCADGDPQDWAFRLSPHLLKLRICFLICKNANIKYRSQRSLNQIISTRPVIKCPENVLFFSLSFILCSCISLCFSCPRLWPHPVVIHSCSLSMLFSENNPNLAFTIAGD